MESIKKYLKVFLEMGFSILMIGERGTGKSKMIKDLIKEPKLEGKVVEANCASFADDTMAESELFGYKRGSFTGANKDKNGLFHEAKEGILFLDEIHHLSKNVQAKLMKSMQTNQDNAVFIRRVGSIEEEPIKDIHFVFATNKNVKELQSILLPDFYDRIAQLIVYIHPLRERKEDREKDWVAIWKQLKFEATMPVPKEKALIDWLREQLLYGNYRDLQKIAMYYYAYSTKFDEEIKKELTKMGIKDAFDYTKKEFEKYKSPSSQDDEKLFFDRNKTTKQMLLDFKYELQKWAVEEFGSHKKAEEHFKNLGDKITERTFNNWKNKV